MKKLMMIALVTPMFLASCGGGKTAEEYGKEYCECKKAGKSNEECDKIEKEAIEKFGKDDEEAEKAYNKGRKSCNE